MFDVADIWAARTNNWVRLVSANDHIHGPRSAHYKGVAVDLHSSDLEGLARTMREAGYDVLWNVRGHYGHVHVEAPPQRRQRAGYHVRPASHAVR
jgi:hypothetical protein